MEMVLTCRQSAKAEAPTDLMVEGSAMAFKLIHPRHNSSGMSVKDGVNTNSSNEEHPLKAPAPNWDMEASREKASFSIWESVEGSVTLVIPV